MSVKKLLSVLLCLSTVVVLGTQFLFISASAVDITEAEFYAKKQELIDWAVENEKTTDSEMSSYYLIQTSSDGGSWSLIKAPQTTENGHQTPYYSTSSPAGIRVYPLWKVQEYGGSIHYDNGASRLSLSGVLSSDVDILNQDGSIYHAADFAPFIQDPAIIAEVSSLVSNFGSIGSFFWGLFQSVLNTIQSNPIILIPVLVVFAFAAILFIISIVRKFGVKNR